MIVGAMDGCTRGPSYLGGLWRIWSFVEMIRRLRMHAISGQ